MSNGEKVDSITRSEMAPFVADKLPGSHLQQPLSIFHRWTYKTRLYFVPFMTSMIVTSAKSKQTMSLSNPKEGIHSFLIVIFVINLHANETSGHQGCNQ